MALFTAMAIGATAGSILSGYQKGQQISRQRSLLNNQITELKRQGNVAKALHYEKSAQAQIFGDYEEARIRRMQAFNTSKKVAFMGGRGASIQKGGTPWNVILSQKAEDNTNVDLHKFKVNAQTTNIKSKGDQVYNDFMKRAGSAKEQYDYLERKTGEMVGMSMLTGGLKGAVQGATIYSAGSTAGWWGSASTVPGGVSGATTAVGSRGLSGLAPTNVGPF